MTVRVDVSPDLLRWAVDRSGLQLDQVERSFPSFGAWVDGAKKPTLKQMQDFAKKTHAPFGMLFLDSVPDEKLPLPDMRTVQSVEVRRPSANLLDTIYTHQLRQQWYRDFALTGGATPLPWVGSVTIQVPPEDVASEMRNLLNRGAAMAWSNAETLRRSLISGLEQLGVLVMVNGVVGSDSHRKLDPEEFRGFTLADEIAPLIFVNGADSVSAQNFTLVHEWAHLWLGGSALSNARPDDSGSAVRAEELWCNKVAAQFLVPKEKLLRLSEDNLTEDGIRQISYQFGVSSLVVLSALYDAGSFGWEDYSQRVLKEREFLSGLGAKRRSSSGGGNYYNTQTMRLGEGFIRAVGVSALEGTTGFKEAYDLLGTKKYATFQNLLSHVGVTDVSD